MQNLKLKIMVNMNKMYINKCNAKGSAVEES